jgi:O-antigen/teichoic acid export membrane protein
MRGPRASSQPVGPPREGAGSREPSGTGARKKGAGDIRRRALTYLPAYVVPAVLGLAVVPFVTRLLGAGQFGIYALCLTLNTFLVALAAQPTSATLNRFYSHTRDEAKRPQLFRALLGLAVTLSGGLMVIVIVGSLALALATSSTRWSSALIATAAVSATFTVFQYLLTVRYVQELAGVTSAAQVAHSVGKTLAVVGGAAAVGTAVGSLAAYAAVAAAMAIILLRGVVKLDGPLFDRELWERAMRYGAPLIVVALSFVALAGFDRAVLAGAAGEATAGRYAAAYVIAEGAIAIPAMLLRNTVYTAVLESYELGDGPRAARLLRRANDGLLVASAPVVVVLGLFGDDVMQTVGGKEYSVPNVVPILITLGLVAYRVGAMESVGFELALDSGDLARSLLCALAIALPVTFGLVIWAGLEGASAATFVSYAAFYAVIRAKSPVRQITAYPGLRLGVAGLATGGVLAIGATAGSLWALAVGTVATLYSAWCVARR